MVVGSNPVAVISYLLFALTFLMSDIIITFQYAQVLLSILFNVYIAQVSIVAQNSFHYVTNIEDKKSFFAK